MQGYGIPYLGDVVIFSDSWDEHYIVHNNCAITFAGRGSHGKGREVQLLVFAV